MAGDMCEIGSVPLPNAIWLTEAVSSFSQSYGEVHPFIATMLCAVGESLQFITIDSRSWGVEGAKDCLCNIESRLYI